MEWVHQFYAKQQEWVKAYGSEVAAHHREQALAVQRLAVGNGRRLLELGAGGGQNAMAMADLGYDVTAVELTPSLAAQIRERAAGRLTVVEGDFYAVELAGKFDVICYFDGFGIGSDADQQRLLMRMATWLKPGGCVLMDIYTPWYWWRAAGQEMNFGTVARRYDFDADGSRMLDRWWPEGRENEAVTQSLRCYSPADLRLLIREAGFTVASVEPGGAVNYETKQYTSRVPLGQAMSYLVKLVAFGTEQ